jgi:hypothetical protein
MSVDQVHYEEFFRALRLDSPNELSLHGGA